MKADSISEAGQSNGNLHKDAPSSPSDQTELTPTQSSTTSTPPIPSIELSQHSSQTSQPPDHNDAGSHAKPGEQAFLEGNKLDKLFQCLRKVGSAIQELVEEGPEATFTSSYRSKEEVPSSNLILPNSKSNLVCQGNGSTSLVDRSVGGRNPVIRTMNEYESLDLSDQRRYLISQLDVYGKQYFKIIENNERRRRKLCHLQSDFITLMLPQFSIIHSIMAEGLRNEWQNKLKVIEELTRILNDVDERLNPPHDLYLMRYQSGSGMNLSASHHPRNHHSALNDHDDNEDDYEEDDIPEDYNELMRSHHINCNGNLNDSSHDINPFNEEVNSSAECLRLATERFALLAKRHSQETNEDGSGIPVDLTTDSDFVNQFSRLHEAVISKKQQPSRKSAAASLAANKYSVNTSNINNVINNHHHNNGCTDPTSPKPMGLHKYKICLFRDGGFRCYYIGKDRSCNMRQHWLHRHGVDTPPEHFYARKDLNDSEVQKYKLKYEVQKSNFPKSKEPLMSNIFHHQQSPAKRAKLSPIQQENTSQV